MGDKFYAKGAKSIYFRVLKMFLLIVMIPFLILLIVYAGLTRNIENLICERNFEIVKTGAEDFERLLSNQENLAVFFECSQDIMNFYYRADPLAEGKTTSAILEAQNDLNAMGIANSDVLNIQMYAARSGALIDYSTCALYLDRYFWSGSFGLVGYDCEGWVRDILQNEEQADFREAKMFFRGNTRDVLIYNRRYASASSAGDNNRIIFYIDASKVKNAFSAAQYEEGFLAVMDSRGTVILSDCLTGEKEQYLADSVFAENGYRKCTIGGRKMLLVNYRSGTLGLSYVLAVPYSDVQAVAEPLIQTMKYFILLAAFVCALLVVRLSVRCSRPLVKVHQTLKITEKNISMDDFVERLVKTVKRNEVMKEEMQRLQGLLQHEVFKNAMMGNVAEKEEIQAAIAQSGIRQRADCYVLLILSWNDLADDINIEEISAQKIYMVSIIRSLEKGEVELVFQLDLEKSVILLSYDGCSGQEARDRVERLVRQVMGEAVRNINYSISVSGDMFHSLEEISRGFFHAKKALSVSQNIFGDHPVQWYEIVKGYFGTMPQDEEEEYASSHNVRVVEEIQKYIVENFSDPGLSLTSIAEVFFITEAYVSKLFKRISGQNFSKYIEKVRMEKARILLEEGKTVKAVSEMVGYNTPQVFRRAWKRCYSGLPSENLTARADREKDAGKISKKS